jgi:biopolymer transport protein ExbD
MDNEAGFVAEVKLDGKTIDFKCIQASKAGPGSQSESGSSAVPQTANPSLDLDSLPGKVIFEGAYNHRSRGGPYGTSRQWIKQDDQGVLTVVTKLRSDSYIARGDKGGRVVEYRIVPEQESDYRLDMTIQEGKVTYKQRMPGEEEKTYEIPVPEGALFDPNTRPDPYCATIILLKGFAVNKGESKEVTAYDRDNAGVGMSSYTFRIENRGKEEVTVPAGTFEVNHLVLTQLTTGDTWYKKRAGHVTDFWVLDNGAFVKIVRHREPYEVELQLVQQADPSFWLQRPAVTEAARSPSKLEVIIPKQPTRVEQYELYSGTYRAQPPGGIGYVVRPNGFRDGEPPYTDRNYTLVGVPGKYRDLTYIQTLNDDKEASRDFSFTFEVSVPVMVYVAHDDRLKAKPPWLQEFEDTGDDFTSSDFQQPVYSIYARRYPRGKVTLGPNCGLMLSSMYLVIVEELPEGKEVERLTPPPPKREVTQPTPATAMRPWGPEQAAGAPDTMRDGDIPTAWAPLKPDAGAEWLRVDFEKAANVAEVRIRETFNPGATSKVTAFLDDGSERVLWEGQDPTSKAPDYFLVKVADDVVSRSVKIYLDTSRKEGLNEIDAVELVGKEGSRQWASSAAANSTYAEYGAPGPEPRVAASAPAPAREGYAKGIDGVAFMKTLPQYKGRELPPMPVLVMDDGRAIVPAQRIWSDTGLDVVEGQTIAFSADGQVRGCHAPIGDWAMGPWGPEGTLAPGTPYQGNRVCALISKVEGGSEVKEFYVGKELSLKAPNSGRLFLGVSDIFHIDNEGTFVVDVKIDGKHVDFKKVKFAKPAAEEAKRPAEEAKPTIGAFVNLDPHVNSPLKGLHTLSGNDLPLNPGEQRIADVVFRIGKGVVQLRGPILEEWAPGRFPSEVKGIKVGLKFRRLHILHATGWGAGPHPIDDGSHIGSYVVHYEDGSTTEIPIKYGNHVRDWWATYGDASEVSEGKVAVLNGRRLFTMAWENSHPDKVVKEIDYVSTGTVCAPFLVAITMEGEGLAAPAEVTEKAERAPARKFGKRAVVAADGSGDTTSIQEAIDGVDEHGTVSIKPGTYREHLVVSKPVSIEGAGRDVTRVETTTEQTAVTIRSCRDVVLRGLTIVSGVPLGEQSSLVLMKVQDADASVEECNLLWAQFGITISGNSNARIDKCLVAAIWGTGIAVGEQASATVTNCEVRNCYHRCITVRTTGEVNIENNLISGSAWHGIRYDHCSPTIVGNILNNHARFGIYASGSGEAKIVRNLFLRNDMAGVVTWGRTNPVIAFNTFAHNKRAGLEMDVWSQPVVENNIFFANETVASRFYSSDSPGHPELGPPLLLSHSLLWENKQETPPPPRPKAERIAELKRQIEEGQQGQAPGEEIDSLRGLLKRLEAMPEKAPELSFSETTVRVGPMFEDAAADNYNLCADSPCRGAGKDGTDIGANRTIPVKSQYPITPEEKLIIPDSGSRDWALWKKGVASPPSGAAKVESPGPAPVKQVEVIIDVTKAGDFVIGGSQKAAEEVSEFFQRVAKEQPDARVIVRAHREAPYRSVLRVLEACEKAGISNVSLETTTVEPEREKPESSAPPPAPAPQEVKADEYSPPDFEGYFPDDPEAGRKLDAMGEMAIFQSTLPDEELLEVVRKGLRRTSQRWILRALGNRYIWGKDPQNPKAIEIMYHATDGPDMSNAVYFGLSVVQEKSPSILRALVDICMRSDDPNVLSRVAWGTKSQRSQILPYVAPYLNAGDEKTREKARIVEQILKDELSAWSWARDKALARARALFTDKLPEIKEKLLNGDSETRRGVIRLINDNAIALIMDDSFIEAWKACGKDPDWRIRNQAARTFGNNLIWGVPEQKPEAIDLMLELSRDEVREVRYNAVYFGLSTVRDKSEAVVKRLVDIAMDDREWNMFNRIQWGLRDSQAIAARILESYMDRYETDPRLASAAFSCYQDIVGKPPPRPVPPAK